MVILGFLKERWSSYLLGILVVIGDSYRKGLSRKENLRGFL